MEINNICLENDGYVFCKSQNYMSHDVFKQGKHVFNIGINELIGEIDSGVWAISYYLSMYEGESPDFVLYKPTEVMVNGISMPINDFMKYSCYMDISYPLFSNDLTVRQFIEQGIGITQICSDAEDIRDMFHLDIQRFERPLNQTGNEIFRAMAAIGYSYGKQVFCFPWLSCNRFDYYREQIRGLLEILETLDVVIIVPKAQ